MNKKIIFILFILMISVGFLTVVASKNDEVESAFPYLIELKGWVEDVEPVTYTYSYNHATYVHDNYYLNGNHFRLTTVKMEHGDHLYFARNYLGARENTVTLQITANDPTISKTMKINPEGKQWEEIKSETPSFSNTLYVDGEELYYRIGKIDFLQSLGYSVLEEIIAVEETAGIDGTKGTARTDGAARIDETGETAGSDRRVDEADRRITQTLGKNGISYSIPLKSTQSTLAETWGILAPHPIINWENRQLASLAAKIEFDFEKKLAVDGAYYLTPESYKPYKKNSYYRNPANLDGLRSIKYLSSESIAIGSIYKNIATHLAYTSARNQSSEGYWPTYPLSEWLNREYDIGYAYMDNRRNVDNSIFLLRYNYLKPDPQLIKAIEAWNLYQIDYIEEYSLPIKNGGILIPDYVGKEKSSYTHISLNHLAANLNYLLESYLITKDDRQLEYAKQLRLGIVNTKHLWVAPDHNLYYALTPELKPYPANDYITLTRDDLMLTQSLLKKVFGDADEDIQYLIDQKNIWIENNYPNKK